jgi:ParB-like nuclease domain
MAKAAVRKKAGADETTETGDIVEETVGIGTLVENPRNPNQHPEDQLVRLVASLRLNGQYKPVLARRANRMLIAGHGIRQAAMRLGWTELRVAFWDVDQSTADRTMLGDNRLGELSRPNKDRIAELLRDIPEDDWLSAGFSDAEAEKFMDDLSDGELVVREIEAGIVHDTFWIAVRGPLPKQAEVLQQMKTLLDEYRDVSIEIGLTEQP